MKPGPGRVGMLALSALCLLAAWSAYALPPPYAMDPAFALGLLVFGGGVALAASRDPIQGPPSRRMRWAARSVLFGHVASLILCVLVLAGGALPGQD